MQPRQPFIVRKVWQPCLLTEQDHAIGGSQRAIDISVRDIAIEDANIDIFGGHMLGFRRRR